MGGKAGEKKRDRERERERGMERDVSFIINHSLSTVLKREREGNQGTKCLLCGPTLKDPSGL